DLSDCRGVAIQATLKSFDTYFVKLITQSDALTPGTCKGSGCSHFWITQHTQGLSLNQNITLSLEAGKFPLPVHHFHRLFHPEFDGGQGEVDILCGSTRTHPLDDSSVSFCPKIVDLLLSQHSLLGSWALTKTSDDLIHITLECGSEGLAHLANHQVSHITCLLALQVEELGLSFNLIVLQANTRPLQSNL